MEDTMEVLDLIISAINLLVFIYFTILVYKYNKTKDDIDFLRQVPLISIEQNENHKYFIKNVGSGPALNIRILSNPNFEDKVWELNEIGFCLFGSTSEIELNFFNKSAYLILYNDIHKKKYFSYMTDNTLEYGSVKDKKLKGKVKQVLDFHRATEQLREEHHPSI